MIVCVWSSRELSVGRAVGDRPALPEAGLFSDAAFGRVQIELRHDPTLDLVPGVSKWDRWNVSVPIVASRGPDMRKALPGLRKRLVPIPRRERRSRHVAPWPLNLRVG